VAAAGLALAVALAHQRSHPAARRLLVEIEPLVVAA
jgi:hypothetical protein